MRIILILIVCVVILGVIGYYWSSNYKDQKQTESEVIEAIENFEDNSDTFVPGEVHGVPEEMPNPTSEATPREE